VLRRAVDYATAYETALKLREMSGTPAEALSPSDLLHGPIAALRSTAAAWLVAGGARIPSEVAGLWRDLKARVGTQVAVAADPAALAVADVAVRLPEVLEWAAPVLAVVPAQVAALRLAELRGVTSTRRTGCGRSR
jgi:glutamine---fructose-6-phosphate transaminase (isomerizing)